MHKEKAGLLASHDIQSRRVCRPEARIRKATIIHAENSVKHINIPIKTSTFLGQTDNYAHFCECTSSGSGTAAASTAAVGIARTAHRFNEPTVRLARGAHQDPRAPDRLDTPFSTKSRTCRVCDHDGVGTISRRGSAALASSGRRPRRGRASKARHQHDAPPALANASNTLFIVDEEAAGDLKCVSTIIGFRRKCPTRL